MILVEYDGIKLLVSVPRVGGGDPFPSGVVLGICWCSPRRRG